MVLGNRVLTGPNAADPGVSKEGLQPLGQHGEGAGSIQGASEEVLSERWQMVVIGVSSFRWSELPGLRSASLTPTPLHVPKLSLENEDVRGVPF